MTIFNVQITNACLETVAICKVLIQVRFRFHHSFTRLLMLI